MGKKKWLLIAAAVPIILGWVLWQLDFPHWVSLDLEKLYAQPRSTHVYDASGRAVGTFSTGRERVWTPLKFIPKDTQNSFLAAEDQRFYDHRGISVRRIIGAALANLRSGGYAQGASTITQQLIKLTHLSSEKTLSRKIQEALLALKLERKLSKSEILECYLNTVYFGNGAYGIHAAAEAYLDKEVSQLTLAESALLAGIIKAPSRYAPHIEPENAVQRRNFILTQMEECGYITAKQSAEARGEILRLTQKDDSPSDYGWVMDAVLSEAESLLSQSPDEIFSAGYSLWTTLDADMQRTADSLYADESNFPADASDGTPVQSAMAVMEPDSGEIKVLVGGRSYEVQRGLNRSVQMKRSPGSAIKPLTAYAAAIDAYGFSPTSFLQDTPREFAGGYAPGNAGGRSYGTVTLREALSRSLNIATVDLADLIGIDAVRSYAQKFGLPLSPQDENLSLSLGFMTYGVTPLQLCSAYSVLANGGKKVVPHLIRRIADAQGTVLYEFQPVQGRMIQPSTAYMITDMLKTAAQSGSAHALSDCGIPVAGKTGTVSETDGGNRDIWTAAYTPDLSAVVWMGFDNPDTVHSLPSNQGGSGYPAQLCAKFLKSVRGRLSESDFQPPAEVKTVLLDALALEQGAVYLADERTPAEYTCAELFHPDDLPRQVSPNWQPPAAVRDLKLLSGSGELPVMEFTAESDLAEYLVLRSTEDETEIAATLSGKKGDVLHFSDVGADLSEPIVYTVLPRHKLLRERGVLLTGKESAAVAYSPGGIMEILLGSDPMPDFDSSDIEIQGPQSLFG